MKSKPNIVQFTVAVLFGVVISGGLFYAMTVIPFEEVSTTISVVVPFVWLTLITVGSLMLGLWLHVQPDNLLGGGILGAFIGFGAFATLVGWSFVMFAIVPITLLAIVMGAWGAYEWKKRSGDVEYASHDGWRYVFVGLAILLTAIPSLLLFV